MTGLTSGSVVSKLGSGMTSCMSAGRSVSFVAGVGPMGAYVHTVYERGFRLAEEHLVRLDNIIRTRTKAVDPDIEIKYRVYRYDDFYIDYGRVSEVVSEENAKRNEIRELSITIEAELIKLVINFSKTRKSFIRLEADNRDLAFLLASELKEFLAADVFIYKSTGFDRAMKSQAVFPLGMMLAFVAGIALVVAVAPVDDPAPALASTNLGEKLDYLIGRKASGGTVWPLMSFFGPFLALPVVFYVMSAASRLFPRNVFYWGKEASIVDRKNSVRGKLFWGIGVTFLIAIVSAFFYDYLRGR
jgi:hypothetical protein